MQCYVCNANLSSLSSARPTGDQEERERGAQGDERGKKGALPPGLVEISSEGTGFAGMGKNTVEREGIVFQC